MKAIHKNPVKMTEMPKHLENLGIFSYGSKASREFEERLIRVVTRKYRQFNDPVTDLTEIAKEGPTAEKTESLMNKHYDMDIIFFKSFLDQDYVAYSMGYYGETIDEIRKQSISLEEAQRRKFELICERARITGSERILDFGCGFGALERYLIERFPNIKIVGMTPSATQINFLKDCLETPADPMSRHQFTLIEGTFETVPISTLGRESFDLIISIGTLEHIKNLKSVFKKMSELLVAEGRAFHHLIISKPTIPSLLNPRETEGIRQYFPGGRIWPVEILRHQTENFECVKDWFINGLNYWRTLEDWHSRFWQNINRIYPETLQDDALIFWSRYFSYCKSVFAPMDGSVVGNGHFLYQKK